MRRAQRKYGPVCCSVLSDRLRPPLPGRVGHPLRFSRRSTRVRSTPEVQWQPYRQWPCHPSRTWSFPCHRTGPWRQPRLADIIHEQVGRFRSNGWPSLSAIGVRSLTRSTKFDHCRLRRCFGQSAIQDEIGPPARRPEPLNEMTTSCIKFFCGPCGQRFIHHLVTSYGRALASVT